MEHAEDLHRANATLSGTLLVIVLRNKRWWYMDDEYVATLSSSITIRFVIIVGVGREREDDSRDWTCAIEERS